jgi:hypothetical protein
MPNVQDRPESPRPPSPPSGAGRGRVHAARRAAPRGAAKSGLVLATDLPPIGFQKLQIEIAALEAERAVRLRAGRETASADRLLAAKRATLAKLQSLPPAAGERRRT